jgi:hypothetical protein
VTRRGWWGDCLSPRSTALARQRGWPVQRRRGPRVWAERVPVRLETSRRAGALGGGLLEAEWQLGAPVLPLVPREVPPLGSGLKRPVGRERPG